MTKHFLLIIYFFTFLTPIWAQNNPKYWIYFKDKTQDFSKISLSNETLEKRKIQGLPIYQYSDIPVNEHYVNEIKSLNIEIIVQSKWLNAISTRLSIDQLKQITSLDFVKSVIPIQCKLQMSGKEPISPEKKMDFALQMLQAEAFKLESLNAKNVKVGVIDAGYSFSREDSLLSYLFKENRILATRDFLNHEPDSLFFSNSNRTETHGTEVLVNLAGYNNSMNLDQRGLATDAQFYLAKTENSAREYRGEEDLWVAAMEWMDSLGVQIINTSLGYAQDMDNEADNYSLQDMDGKTTTIAKAARIAMAEKGIFLVVAAGNEGNNPKWRTVSSPADCEEVLSVGAVNDEWLKESYSSIGSELVSFTKPDVVGYSTNGTSFSSPLICGFVACLIQKAPQLKPLELKEIVLKSGHLYPFKNNYVGMGVPQADKAIAYLDNVNSTSDNYTKTQTTDNSITLEVENKEIYPLLAFHKNDKNIVIYQDVLIDEKLKKKWYQKRKKTEKYNIVINKPYGASSTTVQLGLYIIEVTWK